MNAPATLQQLADPATLLARFADIRAATVALAAPLSAEDCGAQSMPDASPVKWHLAHTTWFFETFILERYEPDFTPHCTAFRVLFNSYYNGVGEKHTRAQRGLLTRPALEEVLAYRRNVDARIGDLLRRERVPAAVAGLLELGLQHEQQHQELILTDLQHLLSCNPIYPAYREPATPAACASALEWIAFAAGVVQVGHAGDAFCFDNETPRHRQFVESFALASRLVTNGEYLAFVEAGGYRDASLWLSEGWDWVQSQQLTQPLYWQATDAGRQAFTLQGMGALALQAPAAHLSYFEADAYARWAGARLPTEAEWEHAAGTTANGLQQVFGACWQWTSSSYAPYPGFAIADGALGEYNGKFMVNQYVLRGSSCATPPGHSRISYRNFFPATARWQFSGIRLARSV